MLTNSWKKVIFLILSCAQFTYDICGHNNTGEMAEWMKSEQFHFSSGLRSLGSRIADIYEAIGGLNLKLLPYTIK